MNIKIIRAPAPKIVVGRKVAIGGDVKECAHFESCTDELSGRLVTLFREHNVRVVRAKRADAGEASRDRAASGEDIRDVTFAGYLSTFKGTTPEDRDGDYVVPGAFAGSIERFMKKNPVLLLDHHKAVVSVAGRFTAMREDTKGLYVEGEISNAPGLADVRWLVSQGHLRTLSMGGLFYYKDDGRGIERVDLYEGSLVAVPANPDAIIRPT